MKKRYYFVWAFMTFLLLCLPTSLHAAENNDHPDEGIYRAIHVDPDDFSDYDLKASATEGDSFDISMNDDLETFSDEDTTSDTGLYRTQMTGLMAEIYDGISSTSINSTNNAATVTHYFKDGEDADSLWDAYTEVYAEAMWGYERDHQDQFLWTTNEVKLYGRYNSRMIVLTITFSVSDFYTTSLGEEAQTQINSVVSGCTARSLETKVKYYHDWLTQTNSYDVDRGSILSDDGTAEFYYAHSAIGCLIKGTGVCESYAKAFKIFCLKENIPCLIVTSSTHAWNYVKMGDGKWYMVDCTWDDPVGGKENYKYYLVSNSPNIDSTHTVDSYFIYPDTTTSKYTHNYVLSTTVPSTCTVAGYEEYKCSDCDETYTKALPLDSDNHEKTTKINVKEASDTERGYTGDTICTGCGAIIEKGTTIPATGTPDNEEDTYTISGSSENDVIPIEEDSQQTDTKVADKKDTACSHSYGNWTTTKAATVFLTGVRTRKCKVCGVSQTRTIAKLTPVIRLSKTSLTMKVKKKYQLKVTMAKGDSVKSWKSGNKKIALITSKGIIKAKKKGKVTITVTLKSGKKATCKVKVR